MTDYEWLTEMGLCHRCRKEKVAPGKKFCFDCIDKYREENAKRYDPEYAKEYQKKRREIYAEKKKKGICVRCNKKATHGMYCLECSIKVKRHNTKTAERRKQQRHERGLVPVKRTNNRLCLYCGNALTDNDGEFKVCQSCREKASEYGKIGAKNSPFRALEKQRYEKNRRWRNEHIHTTLQETE